MWLLVTVGYCTQPLAYCFKHIEDIFITNGNTAK